MTDEQKQVFFDNWHNQWIRPEIDKRFDSTGVPDNFKIRECLVMLPRGQSPIVQFNDEFGWMVQNPNMSNGKILADFEVGQPIHLYDILKIDGVLPPTVNGERVAFMYLYWDGFHYQLFVDFLPNQPDYDSNDDRFTFSGSVIAHHLQNIIIERIVIWAKQHIAQIRGIGLWIATPLLPYPLSKIVERVDAGEPEEARRLLVEYCDSEFITDKLVKTWYPIKVFRDRQQVFDEAIQAHKCSLYHASISTLINHIEGVIVDWLHEHLPPSSKVEKKTKSRIAQFHDVLLTIPQFEYMYREALEATIGFLRENDNGATPFQIFNNWLDKIDPNFPSRHAISHGKYVPELYTEENSIKLFLLLDTICQFMMFYEVRVLGRDLGNIAEKANEPHSP